MDSIALDLGFISITWYALIIVAGMLLSLFIIEKEVKKHDVNEKIFFDYIFYMVIFGFIFARIWYVSFELGNYMSNPISVFYIWEGGIAIHGGILGGVLTTIYFSKKHNIKFFKYTDLVVSGLIITQSFGRWGNFINKEAYGPQTSLDFLSQTLHLPKFIVDGMNINGNYYHPTFLYESIWNFFGFLIIILLLRPKYRFNYGIISGFYLMWYGFFRYFLEYLRIDALDVGNIEVAKVACIVMFVSGLYIIIKKGDI